MTQPLFYFLLGIGASLLALCLLGAYLEYSDKDQEMEEVEAEPVYSEEDIALANFLQDKQAVNEAYLSAQAQLLKQLRKS
ncbi:TPA: hypothetical protein ACIRHY_001960 [Streptococcus suis]|uniref:Uncharacterized protein n=1 Tax=Streptococcus suis TaxID=1307 RepID=A0A123UCW1_STRSU|nr:hypothetical protein [Streptococcus suis]NQG45981.1 hypothetical protein [Streptococcus suis]RRN52116.1 hypothetical protein EI220_02815 [Streptococcus suis]CYW25300.1 Uncharacterised protein [Streptococcus suis]HEL1905960.1 hypothetical protein [Streptococcus suis]HEL2392774.1 hypothetical protein [Streptococcus suis]